MHDQNCFITLTLDDDHLVYGGQQHAILVPRDLELFWKQLRKRTGRRFRYFACGEYGSKSNRPHYHACVFGLDFEDKKLWKVENGINLYTSDFLDSVWKRGMCTVGDVTFESAAYVARYTMKKHTRLDALLKGIPPEFIRMSRGGRGKHGLGGIGSSWYDKFKTDVFPHDKVSIRGGIQCKPPKYYSRKFKSESPLAYEDIEWNRYCYARSKWRDNTPLRLGVRYRVKLAQIASLKRSL